MKTQNKPQMKDSANAGRRTITDPAAGTLADEAAKRAKKKVVASRPAAPATKAGKAVQPPRLSRVAFEGKNLVCRYCGSDDLAPSFVKRRDARCRACFKQRYGSARRDTRTKPVRQAKSAK
jgi:hypothetical protein